MKRREEIGSGKGRYGGIVAVMIMTGLACSLKLEYSDTAEHLSEGAVALFHQRLDEGRYDDLADSLSQRVRESSEKTQVLAELKKAHDEFGSYLSSEKSVAACFPGEVRLGYHTRFKNGDATEVFRWSTQERHPTLLEYHVWRGFSYLPEDGEGCGSAGTTQKR